MSEEMKKDMNNENQENKDQAPAEDKQQGTTASADKPEKVGLIQRVKDFAKTKAIPAAKFVGKGLIKGATVAGGALATAYFIGAAAGGYAAAKEKANEESNKDQEQSSSNEPAADKSADPEKTDDVQVVITESNIATTEE